MLSLTWFNSVLERYNIPKTESTMSEFIDICFCAYHRKTYGFFMNLGEEK